MNGLARERATRTQLRVFCGWPVRERCGQGRRGPSYCATPSRIWLHLFFCFNRPLFSPPPPLLFLFLLTPSFVSQLFPSEPVKGLQVRSSLSEVTEGVRKHSAGARKGLGGGRAGGRAAEPSATSGEEASGSAGAQQTLLNEQINKVAASYQQPPTWIVPL